MRRKSSHPVGHVRRSLLRFLECAGTSARRTSIFLSSLRKVVTFGEFANSLGNICNHLAQGKKNELKIDEGPFILIFG
ncbi:hypothetical protein Y032_0089g2257 [Ancylostoma ceylanicum]|nr:hypothetical protein Y032_0089g2257 [Ancylostoma ceylanicum]